MRNPWLHRSAIVVAVLALIVIEFGAFVTSTIRPLTGLPPGPVWPHIQQVHIVLAGVLAVLMLGLAFRLMSLPGWIALAGIVVVYRHGYLHNKQRTW